MSWGQRIFGMKVPEIMTTFNVQNEINLHNLGSTSFFENVFFLLTLSFFVGVPLLVRKYPQIKNYLSYYLFPLPHRSAIYVFLITLLVWLVIGIRFGTLGFGPFSFYAEKYNTQMEDEVFELLTAYSFFTFSIMESKKRVETVEPHADLPE